MCDILKDKYYRMIF